jgi:hypothetical protein
VRLRGGPRVSSVVRSKTADGKIHLFPYGQLVSASLVRTEDSEIVRIAFANSDVEITGRNLRDLFHALQDFAVKWVRKTLACKKTLACPHCDSKVSERAHVCVGCGAEIVRDRCTRSSEKSQRKNYCNILL